MRQTMRKFLLTAGLVMAGTAAHAGPIETACLASPRANGDRALCGWARYRNFGEMAEAFCTR
jgi:hypothetical protein